MDISTYMNPSDLARLEITVDSHNQGLKAGRQARGVLDRNDFLKILITQLTHQDPTQPLEDKEFVSQMATFSTLEQMTNMNQDIAMISSMLQRSQALGLLGRIVDIAVGGTEISGVVSEVSAGDPVQVVVGGQHYDYQDVLRVRSGE